MNCPFCALEIPHFEVAICDADVVFYTPLVPELLFEWSMSKPRPILWPWLLNGGRRTFSGVEMLHQCSAGVYEIEWDNIDNIDNIWIINIWIIYG